MTLLGPTRYGCLLSVAAVPELHPDPRHLLGRAGERLALEHLQRLGYRLVARNYRTRFGEIDLVVENPASLVFVEVKTRRSERPGATWDALDERKRRRVRRLAAAFLSEAIDRPRRPQIRFDAVGVTIDGRGLLVCIDHLEDAF